MSSGEPAEDAVQVLMREVSRLTALEQRLRVERDNLIEARRTWEESVDHYSELFEVTPMPALTLDSAGFVRQANTAAVAFLGPSVVGSALRSRIEAQDRRRFLDLVTIAGRDVDEDASCELTLRRSDGTLVRTRLKARHLMRGGASLLVTLLDLSESDRAEEEHRRLRETAEEARAATEGRDKFIAMLSHELRTPLTPVMAAVSAALHRDDAPPPLKKTFAMIARNLEAERRLIDDLLDTSRIAHGKMRLDRAPVDVHRIARETVASMMPEIARKGLSVAVELGAKRCWVSADAGRIRQVFWNLVQNAIKFSAEGGHLALHSWDREGVIAIEVRDTGAGIAPDVLARLFAPFQQGPTDQAAMPSRSGLGLGLAICRGILELHGGQIHATSPGAGSGARFVLDLPTIDPPFEDEQRAVTGLAPTPQRKAGEPHILLVEDDEDTAETLAELLRSEGFEISVATSIASALRQDVGEVDLVLSDIGLGDGSGLELMRRLRAKKELPGIALSGYATEADIVASHAAGFSAHLVKPVSIDKLVATIHRAQSGAVVGAA